MCAISIMEDLVPPESEANQPVSRILGAIPRESDRDVLSY
jgi:hypothetical protein